MRVTIVYYIMICVVATVASGSDVSAVHPQPEAGLLKMKKPAKLCSQIASGEEAAIERQRPGIVRKWQTTILDAAGVNIEKDSDKVVADKVSTWWQVNKDGLICDDFDRPKGNLLKFAVSKNAEEFLQCAVDWKMGLNTVDRVDEKTVLDYVEDQIQINREDKDLVITLKRYWDMLRSGGAKARRELPPG
jgi:hypothetical protein